MTIMRVPFSQMLIYLQNEFDERITSIESYNEKSILIHFLHYPILIDISFSSSELNPIIVNKKNCSTSKRYLLFTENRVDITANNNCKEEVCIDIFSLYDTLYQQNIDDFQKQKMTIDLVRDDYIENLYRKIEYYIKTIALFEFIHIENDVLSIADLYYIKKENIKTETRSITYKFSASKLNGNSLDDMTYFYGKSFLDYKGTITYFELINKPIYQK